MRPIVAAVAGIAAPEAFWQVCRDELSGVDVAGGSWDIRARWFGVVICATPRLGVLGRDITIPWRVIAAQFTPGSAAADLRRAWLSGPGRRAGQDLGGPQAGETPAR